MNLHSLLHSVIYLQPIPMARTIGAKPGKPLGVQLPSLASSPPPIGGLQAGPSAGHSSSLANRNAAAQGPVNSPDLYKPLGMVRRTRCGHIIKPAGRDQIMATHCSVPLPLSTLDVLGPRLCPTTFSAVLFAGEDQAPPGS